MKKSAPVTGLSSRSRPDEKLVSPSSSPVQKVEQESISEQLLQQETRIITENTAALTTNMEEKLQAKISDLEEKLIKCMDCMTKLMSQTDPCMPYRINKIKIQVPTLAPSSSQPTTLERFWRLEKRFRGIPLFDDRKTPIREFLRAMVSVTDTFPLAVRPTDEEYFQLIWGKLCFNIQSELKDMNIEDSEQLHNALIENYDMSEREDEAYIKLQSLKPSTSLNCVKRLLKEANRLKGLFPGTDLEKARSFGISLKSFLPWRLEKKLADLFLEFSKTEKDHPNWEYLESYCKAHEREIDQHVDRILQYTAWNTSQHDTPFINNTVAARTTSSKKSLVAMNEKALQKITCHNCNKLGHTQQDCWRLKRCENCGKSGHPTSNCRTFCRLCGLRNHNSIHCRKYPGEIPMSQPCKFCQSKFGAVLYHSEETCNHR